MTSTTAHHRPQSLPCVLPQINHTLFGGKYNSPFVRAYSPSLSTYGIPEASFLSFIDGLNETFITNPALESVTHVGMGLSAFGGPHGALIGKAVKFAPKGASRTMNGSVMPLTYHTTAAAPAAANTDNWLKRMGEEQAAKKTASQTAKKFEDYSDAHAKRDRKNP
ncbi:hypothetical protein D6D19_04020 [Aureobasidium pullulans]|uniref:Uncharacterized protein n=1 Tax=Aureobasidium pullulans TaxID=5580 RepID=A0A4S9A8D7_AURPU|nr:hypothetical protein D6D19_04020 [Aureobasidium pullulans]